MEKKVALVTGASRGIGRQISLTLAKEGMFVIVNYCGSEARAKGVLEEIRENGGDGCIYQCDVADYQQTEAMARDLIKTYGHVDVLVNNAGITRDNLILRMSEEEFDAVVETNLKGCFHTIRHLSRYFQHRIGFRRAGKCRAGKLCGIEGRNYRAYEDGGERTGKQRDYSQCGGSGICPYGDDGGTFGAGERGSSSTDPAGEIWRTGGYRECGGISGV